MTKQLCMLRILLTCADKSIWELKFSDFLRSCGLFRLTDPDGMNILKNCQEKGFHPHTQPDNGNPVYEHCPNVYKNSNLRFEIFDLR